MQRTEANKLVSSTFGGAFDRSRYESFIRELLKSFEPKQFTGNRARTGNYIYEPYRDLVESFERIGKYEDADNKTIDILVVRLKPGQKIDRARTKQRNFIAYYLEYGRDDGTTRDAALVAFVEADSKTWRFSLVRMEYEIVRAESGKIKTEKNLSPARRFSFLVGEGENTHTAQARFVPIIEDDSSKPTLETINQAFSVESITEEFFESYRELFHKLCESLEAVCKKDSIVREEFKEKGIEISDFAKKLLGQIVFLYFLQRKGWLGVDERKKWGTGPRNFLRRLFDKELIQYKNFFNDALEYLFYDMLAVDKGEGAWHEKFNCRIPFLNGGLFEPLFDYDWRKTHILIPNEVFSNRRAEGDFESGSGILDIFDRYNFTVREDEPLEKEVAIDPELLGKVFENLLEVRDRKTKGSYYTPREIVHYMCQESLISYLEHHLEGKVSKGDLVQLIRFGDINVINDSLALSPEKRDLKKSKFQTKLPDSIISNADEIDKLLARIKVCDPAVGSGAFPLGMLNEIVRARFNLNPALYDGELDVEDRDLYTLKWHSIESSIYGVDLDPGAVEIAKLRLWLSLIVDEESINKIKPLPNLDFKLMQGNSLIDQFEGVQLIDPKSLNQSYRSERRKELLNKEISELQREYFQLVSKGSDSDATRKTILEDAVKKRTAELKILMKPVPNPTAQTRIDGSSNLLQENLERLKRMHQQFFNASSQTEKKKLKDKIIQLEWEVMESAASVSPNKDAISKLRLLRKTNTRPFFLWQLQFSEVFSGQDGFDVVIANPPYVRQESVNSNEQEQLKSAYPEVFKGTADLFVYFYALAIKLLRENGQLAFITSNKYMRAGYGDKIREHLTSSLKLGRLIDFGDLPVFNVIAYPAVILGEKETASQEHLMPVVDLSNEIKKRIEKRNLPVNTITVRDELRNLNQLLSDHSIQDYPQRSLRKEGWVLEDTKLLALFEKLRKMGAPLGEMFKGRMYRGILTGLNEAFVIDGATREKLIQADKNSSELIKPWLQGKDIKKWKPEWSGLYIIAIQSSGDKDCKNPWRQAASEKEARSIFEQAYPAIYQHVMKWEEYPDPRNPKRMIGLKPRADQGKYFWELRACAYYSLFEKNKICWGNLAVSSKFAIDDSGAFVGAPANCLIDPPDWLCALMNSSTLNFMYPKFTVCRSGSFQEFKISYIGNVPILKPDPSVAKKLRDLAEKVSLSPSKSYEDEINDLIFNLYGLSKAERQIVQNATTVYEVESQDIPDDAED